jgi:Holliday junction DNA helicase RuvA
MTAGERDMFRLLVHAVSGIGPKTALSILSGINLAALRSAVAMSDVKALSQISGVGKKTAERIVVELRDKLGKSVALEPGAFGRVAASSEDAHFNDAIAALTALGYKQPDAHEAVRGAQALLGLQAGVEQLVRAALKKGA